MKEPKVWRPFNDECLNCGCDVEVFTDSGMDNCVFDGDEARCTECKAEGTVIVNDQGDDDVCSAHISWKEGTV